jgi:prophage DNA circulation protein
MSWRESLRKASFRGVEFHVDNADTDFGRRNVIHEYPLRDVPYAEDMGKKAREINIRAYVIGEDFIARGDALMAAIEKYNTPGTLVHPRLGSIVVTPKPCRHGYSKNEGGIEYFDLVFIEYGENKNPETTVDTQSKVKSAASNLQDAAKEVFGQIFGVQNLPDFVTESATSQSLTMANQIQTAAGLKQRDSDAATVLVGSITTFKANLSEIIQDPTQWSAEASTLIDGIQTVYPSAKDAYVAYVSLLDYGEDLTPVQTTTATREQEAKNQEAIIRFVRRSALVGMAQAVSNMSFESYNDAVKVREDVAQWMDDELVVIGGSDEDAVFLTLQSLRAAVISDITSRAGTLKKVKQVVNQKTIPALAMAYDLFEDVAQESDLIARNKVRHPGFMPAGKKLEILV